MICSTRQTLSSIVCLLQSFWICIWENVLQQYCVHGLYKFYSSFPYRCSRFSMKSFGVAYGKSLTGIFSTGIVQILFIISLSMFTIFHENFGFAYGKTSYNSIEYRDCTNFIHNFHFDVCDFP